MQLAVDSLERRNRRPTAAAVLERLKGLCQGLPAPARMRGVPAQFVCPISMDLMRDPVSTVDGQVARRAVRATRARDRESMLPAFPPPRSPAPLLQCPPR